MIMKIPNHHGDGTCSSCAVAGDFVYLAHHGGGHDKKDVEHQMRATFDSVRNTLTSVGATLNDMLQINLYLKDLEDFDKARAIFYEYFDKDRFPARMTSTTEFLDENCLCMMDGVAYRPKLTE